MPIQKLAAPATSLLYSRSGGGARHTLYASTTVLQAGKSSEDTVLAVVTATGMHPSKRILLGMILHLSTQCSPVVPHHWYVPCDTRHTQTACLTAET